MHDSRAHEKSGGSNIAVSVGVALLLLYFLCPAAFVLPLFAVYGSRATYPPAAVRGALEVFFAPITFLEDRMPGYHVLLHKEAQLFGLSD